jgi:hypothetical protein
MTQYPGLSILYMSMLLWRFLGLRAVWYTPMFHGSEWFFDTRVTVDFYSGMGRRLLREYRTKLLLPYYFEALASVLVLYFLGFPYVLLTAAASALAGSVYHGILARRYARMGPAFRAPDAEQPVSSVAVSLETRRLASYTMGPLEVAIVLSALIAAGALIYAYAAGSGPFRDVFFFPAVLLYVQAGLLLLKRGVVNSSLGRVPGTRTEQYLAWNEATRKFVLIFCDWCRALCALALLGVALLWLQPASWSREAWSHTVLLWPLSTLSAGLWVWGWIALKRYSALARAMKPVELRTRATAAISLTGRRTQICAAYFAGLAALVIVGLN